jgi:hypothetical protein
VLRTIAGHPMLAAVCVVGIVLCPLLVGFAPLGGDPELMYLPIKVELSRALAAGGLPFWSDRFGLGVPLVAESHVAAFYPPNWIFYRFLDVPVAYRLTMWVHMLGLVVATFAYARVLGIGREGAALVAVAFALCGFQAVHAVHEPFIHLMPYLPLCLLLADRFAMTGRLVWLAGLALAWGTQITLGHFQIQMWTAGLVLLAGGWRSLVGGGRAAQKLGRIAGLVIGLAWGAAIAMVQLRLTWELTGVAGFVRPPQFLSNYLLPPAHWAQFALPELFLGLPLGRGDSYWTKQGTTPGEASAYVGVVPFILACVGAVAAHRDRALTPWRLIAPLSLALATMPGWWPDAFFILLQLPGLGWFRAPARYTLLTCLGLAILAGRGFDHQVASRRFWVGLALAILGGTAAWGWSIHCARGAEFQAGMGINTFPARFATAGLAWGLGIAAIVGWRLNRLGAWAPLLVAAIELAGLFYLGPVWWRREIRLPQRSTVLSVLAALPDVGLVAGRLFNLPVNGGQTTAYPNLGITAPPPNYLLEQATSAPMRNTELERRWQRRFGVTHGVWAWHEDVSGTEALAAIVDPALDEVIGSVPSLRAAGLGPWKLVRNLGAFPSAWVALRVHEAKTWGRLYAELSLVDSPDEAWILSEDHPPSLPAPAATAASVQSWDGRTAVVEHDGSCILIMRRIHYPGWICRVDDGPDQPVLKVDGGLQGILLVGSGTSRVSMRYRPTGLRQAARVSLAALALAVIVLGTAGVIRLRIHRRPTR